MPKSYSQKEALEAGKTFSKTEGIVPAPETSHAIRAVIDEAIDCRKSGEEKVILFNFSGHGLLDLKAYEDLLNGELMDFDLTEEFLRKSTEAIPNIEHSSP